MALRNRKKPKENDTLTFDPAFGYKLKMIKRLEVIIAITIVLLLFLLLFILLTY